MSKSTGSLVVRFAHAEEFSSIAKAILEQSREAHSYNTTMFNYANEIQDIIENGTLGDKVDAEIALQSQDVNKAAKIGLLQAVKTQEIWGHDLIIRWFE